MLCVLQCMCLNGAHFVYCETIMCAMCVVCYVRYVSRAFVCVICVLRLCSLCLLKYVYDEASTADPEYWVSTFLAYLMGSFL